MCLGLSILHVNNMVIPTYDDVILNTLCYGGPHL